MTTKLLEGIYLTKNIEEFEGKALKGWKFILENGDFLVFYAQKRKQAKELINSFIVENSDKNSIASVFVINNKTYTTINEAAQSDFLK